MIFAFSLCGVAENLSMFNLDFTLGCHPIFLRFPARERSSFFLEW